MNRKLSCTPRHTHRNFDGAAADVDATHLTNVGVPSDNTLDDTQSAGSVAMPRCSLAASAEATSQTRKGHAREARMTVYSPEVLALPAQELSASFLETAHDNRGVMTPKTE